MELKQDGMMENGETSSDIRFCEWLNRNVKTDPIVDEVIKKFHQRSQVGIKKYGTTLHENNNDDFINHLQEELMDAILYLQKIKTLRNEI
jgi:thioredoxin-related protein